eukprot:g14098.t1
MGMNAGIAISAMLSKQKLEDGNCSRLHAGTREGCRVTHGETQRRRNHSKLSRSCSFRRAYVLSTLTP